MQGCMRESRAPMSANDLVHVAVLRRGVPMELSYLVPAALRGELRVGHAVSVPLRGRIVTGIVSAFGGVAPKARLFEVHSRLDAVPLLNEQQLALARWIAAEYGARLGLCCALMVPSGLTPASAEIYALAEPPVRTSFKPHTVVARIIGVLREHGPLVRSSLARRLRGANGWRTELDRLVDVGVAVRSSPVGIAPPPRRNTLVQLVLSEDTLDLVLAQLEDAGQKSRVRADVRGRRAGVLRSLQRSAGIAWADWLLVETGARREDLNWLAQEDYIVLGDAQRWCDPLSETDYIVRSAPALTDDQQRAWDAIRAQPGGAFVLRGVDGSGKTEIAMYAVQAALEQGKGALVLVPEIDLAPQLARRFLERFPGQVALIHSRLKPSERYAAWRRIRAGEQRVVVGARSALFAPLANIGVIVVDQEHDASYKQPESPYYDARRVARQYAAQVGATLILNSATPTLEALHSAEFGSQSTLLDLLELTQRVRAPVLRLQAQGVRCGVVSSAQGEVDGLAFQPLPQVEVVDMRAELAAGNISMFSRALQEGLAHTLQRREQAILYLNRRGTASMVTCRDCGHVMRCPRDDSPLAWHGDDLRCHVCSHRQPAPVRCPACRSARIRYFGAGTLAVEEEVLRRFPHARVVRIDRDSIRAAGALEQLLRRFVSRQADVLIGAHSVAKGLDLPLATLVGVVLADIGLFVPDFRAGERTFQTLEQLSARAGRALQPGRVVVQTYNPDHAAIRSAAAHDGAGFARRELAERRRLRLPPWTRLVRFVCADTDEAAARARAVDIARRARNIVAANDVIGPAACYFSRRGGRFRWQVLVRCPEPRELLVQLGAVPGAAVDVDPVGVL